MQEDSNGGGGGGEVMSGGGYPSSAPPLPPTPPLLSPSYVPGGGEEGRRTGEEGVDEDDSTADLRLGDLREALNEAVDTRACSQRDVPGYTAGLEEEESTGAILEAATGGQRADRTADSK